jgi:hypothetical protein
MENRSPKLDNFCSCAVNHQMGQSKFGASFKDFEVWSEQRDLPQLYCLLRTSERSVKAQLGTYFD